MTSLNLNAIIAQLKTERRKMTTPQHLINAQQDLETIMRGMLKAFVRWERGTYDADEYGEKLANIIDALDDYRQAYAPTDREREAQDQGHADELAQDVFQDAQEETV